ncbi:MAG: class I SAM-dependent RNA methyltransferase [Clostridia bacterium]|nr:class I SAM-dependent RNA methyltransferase [Clostridia bacterium]
MNYELIATATFGLEAIVRREIEGLGYEIIKTEDGKVTFAGDERAIVRSNLWLRCADRVLLKVAEFEARTFEELFQGTKAVAWERIIPVDGEFTVTCTTVKSQLHNPPAIQSITKKAVVERMKMAYGFDRFKETGAAHTIKATFLKDRVTLTVDTSGEGLHKRGYRVANVDAPMKETLAAALVQLSFWKPGRILLDPCCGSGTIPIEAALMARNIAPGCNREFDAEKWHFIDRKIWMEERLLARDGEDTDSEIFASDIDPKAVAAARKNAEAAGVDDIIAFARADVRSLKAPEGERGIVVSNPPYGERIGESDEIDGIFRALGKFSKENPDWSIFVITPDKDAEKKIMGRKADRRRKLYNGNIETTYYQFHGIK